MSIDRVAPLSDEGVAEFERLIEEAKARISKAADEAIGDVYVNLGMWIESDTYLNMRNAILRDLCDYFNDSDSEKRSIRQAIYRQFKDEIVADLNHDFVEEIEKQRELIKYQQETLDRRPY